MAYDESKIEDAVLALLAAFSFDGGRAWKGFDFDVMDRLHAQDFIENPASKNKSVWLTPQGLERGRKVAEQLFRPAQAMPADISFEADGCASLRSAPASGSKRRHDSRRDSSRA